MTSCLFCKLPSSFVMEELSIMRMDGCIHQYGVRNKEHVYLLLHPKALVTESSNFLAGDEGNQV